MVSACAYCTELKLARSFGTSVFLNPAQTYQPLLNNRVGYQISPTTDDRQTITQTETSTACVLTLFTDYDFTASNFSNLNF